MINAIMKKIRFASVVLMLILTGVFCQPLFAQGKLSDLEQTILRYDSLFWNAYNTCDTTEFKKYFVDDLEFYHDKGGITKGLENLVAVTKKNLCGSNDFRLRREAVSGTVKVFPLQNADVIYGAIISGEHVFYTRQGGKERLDGLAKFTHLWLLKDGVWKMTRILSYNHGPAPQPDKKLQASVPPQILDRYAGTYNGPQTGEMMVSRKDDHLQLSIKQQVFDLYPETNSRFFVKERDLIFEFVQTTSGSKIVVRENGNIVEEALRRK